MSLDRFDFFDESDNDGYRSGSPGKYVVSAGESVGILIGVGFGDFIPNVIESLGDVFLLVVFVPRGVESKGGQLIESFWRPKY